MSDDIKTTTTQIGKSVFELTLTKSGKTFSTQVRSPFPPQEAQIIEMFKQPNAKNHWALDIDATVIQEVEAVVTGSVNTGVAQIDGAGVS